VGIAGNQQSNKIKLNIEDLCKMGGYLCPEQYKNEISVFVVNEHTAIPYTIIKSNEKCN